LERRGDRRAPLTRDAVPSRQGSEDRSGEARCLRLLLGANLAEVEKARRLVDEIRGACGLSEDRAFDIKVALSEACANAIEHGSSETLVVAWLFHDRVLLEVSNEGGFLPGLRSDTDQRRRGLGLPLMASLADQLHVSRLGAGITRVSLAFFTQGFEAETASVETWASHQAVFATLEAVAAAPTLRDAGLTLLEWARGLTGCEGGMVRLWGSSDGDACWLPAIVHSGLRNEFLREEALIRRDECMCGRVCMGLTDPGLPFFTSRGSFLWGKAQSIAAQFGAETLGEVRGRCITEGFDSVAVFPLAGEDGPIGVLHLVDRETDRFSATAGVLEWACRVSGRVMSRDGAGQRQAAVREAVERLKAS
jgi:serine/threonine-protein kinase RsbW